MSRFPQHVAIVMDGNGRWAEAHGKPRHAGHRAGVDSVRAVIESCARKEIAVLTLFAFSSENWQRPQEEVGLLMELFLAALQREAKRLHRNNIRMRVIGDANAFPEKLQQRIRDVEQLTAGNDGLLLQIAANYGGRWDITQAVRQLAALVASGALQPEGIDEASIAARLSFADAPDPDLFIRTGGERRMSNFMLWQSAYTEFYFTDTYWPDFREEAFEAALSDFGRRQRRFGKTGAQVDKGGE